MFHCLRASLGGCALLVTLLLVCPGSLRAQTGTVGLNFTGLTFVDAFFLQGFGYVPPDNAGAVGPNDIVQLNNGAYSVYSKSTGALTNIQTDREFWQAAGVDPGPAQVPGIGLTAFNARIVYDPTVQRWFAAELTSHELSNPSNVQTNNSVLLARSNTSNPADGWKAVSFLGNAGGDGKFADYTGLGIDANGVYISANMFSSRSGGSETPSLFSVPKADLLAVNPSLTNMTRFDGLSEGFTPQPVINFGPNLGHTPVISTIEAASASFLMRQEINGSAGAGATLTPSTLLPVNTYSVPPLIAQPDGTRTMNTIIETRLSANVNQVGNVIYTVQAVEHNGNSAIQWTMIRESDNHIIQQGVLSDPAFDYSQPSIAANEKGDIVIGFTRSGFGAGGNLSAFAVVGKTVGAVTTFGTPFLLKASSVGNHHNPNGRWGDYTTTVVDPSNSNIFWTFQEFALSSNNAWGTQITQIIVPEPGSVVMGGMALAGFLVAAMRYRRRRRA